MANSILALAQAVSGSKSVVVLKKQKAWTSLMVPHTSVPQLRHHLISASTLAKKGHNFCSRPGGSMIIQDVHKK